MSNPDMSNDQKADIVCKYSLSVDSMPVRCTVNYRLSPYICAYRQKAKCFQRDSPTIF